LYGASGSESNRGRDRGVVLLSKATVGIFEIHEKIGSPKRHAAECLKTGPQYTAISTPFFFINAKEERQKFQPGSSDVFVTLSGVSFPRMGCWNDVKNNGVDRTLIAM
jgi:hypothetical protein